MLHSVLICFTIITVISIALISAGPEDRSHPMAEEIVVGEDGTQTSARKVSEISLSYESEETY